MVDIMVKKYLYETWFLLTQKSASKNQEVHPFMDAPPTRLLIADGLEQERLLQPVADDTCQITYEGYPCDLLHVPSEGDLLQSHDNDTSSRADDEHRTAYTGTVS